MRSTRIVLLWLMGALSVLLIWPMPLVQAQTQEYNVLEYGASNDGVTPTEVAVNRLSEEIGEAPATLVFPGGTYLVCGILRYRSNQTWKFLDHATVKLGNGCVSRLIDTALGMTLVGILQPAARGQSNITFLHLAIDGNKSNNPTTNSGNGLDLYDVSDVLVSSPRIQNVPRDGLVIGGGSSIPTNITIYRPVLLNNGLPGVNGGSGLAIVRGRGIVVTEIWAAENSMVDIDLEPNPQDPPDAISEIQINGGVLGSLSAETPGIRGGLSISSSNGLQVSGVLITKVISVGNLRGFRVEGARDIRLQGCLAYRNGQEGFRIDNATGIVMQRNRAIQNGQSMPNLYSGFRINGSDNLLESNQANDNQNAPTQRYGFEEVAGSDGNTFVKNIARGNVSGSYVLVGPYSVWQ
jgi:parallel beta-helix repeat protein